MPKGIPKKGFRVHKSWAEADMQEVERRLASRYPSFLDQIEALTKPIQCPNCQTVVKTPDREALIYLCDRVAGKPVQKQELDVIRRVQLSADQVEGVIERNADRFIEYLQVHHPDKLEAHGLMPKLLTS